MSSRTPYPEVVRSFIDDSNLQDTLVTDSFQLFAEAPVHRKLVNGYSFNALFQAPMDVAFRKPQVLTALVHIDDATTAIKGVATATEDLLCDEINALDVVIYEFGGFCWQFYHQDRSDSAAVTLASSAGGARFKNPNAPTMAPYTIGLNVGDLFLPGESIHGGWSNSRAGEHRIVLSYHYNDAIL